jgi:hypothetical protein
MRGERTAGRSASPDIDMLNRRSVFCVPLSCVAVLSCYGQTPLAKSFADLKSTDPKVADEARKHLGIVFEQELPTIEKDTQLL